MEERYDKIGIGYNDTRKADPYLLSRMEVLLALKKDGHYLDIGSGTGNYTIGLHDKGYAFTGVEPAQTMIEVAKAKSKSIIWKQGKAEKIPMADDSVNGVLACVTIHHWKNLRAGFREVFRVLEPGGRFLIYTGWPDQMDGYWLNHYFPEMIQTSKKVMPSEKRVIAGLKASGFQNFQQEKYFVQPDMVDSMLYHGKKHPERYLDPNVRKGISSFSAFSNEQEVQQGLIKLQADIADQSIEKIISQYENDLGDYVFVLAEKPNHE